MSQGKPKGRPPGPPSAMASFRLTQEDLDILDRLARGLQLRHGGGDRTRALRWAIRCLDQELGGPSDRLPPK
jgi:hypothetical protein